jgi:hypothetical protein
MKWWWRCPLCIRPTHLIGSLIYSDSSLKQQSACRHVIVWYLDLQLPMQSVPIATDVSSNPDQGEVNNIMSVTCSRLTGFLQVLQFPPPIKLIATIWLKYSWKWRWLYNYHKTKPSQCRHVTIIGHSYPDSQPTNLRSSSLIPHA